MISQNLIKEKLYEKYIEPTKRKKDKQIGIEIELPIINLSKEAVDFMVIHKVTEQFMEKFGFEVDGVDDEGNIYSAVNKENGDILSYDCSYNNLEISLGIGKELNELFCRFKTYYSYMKTRLNKYNYALTGMGINPYRIYNKLEPIPNGRYRMLLNHLKSYEKYDAQIEFHDYPEFGLFSSASQVQLDVEYDDLIKTINVFSKLEPIKSLLFSNSVLLGEREDLLCARDMFWEKSSHGINPKNIGMFEKKLTSVDDLLEYIYSTSIYCVERGDKYINFKPIEILEYFKKDFVEGEYFNGSEYEKIRVVPKLSDIAYLRTFKFEDLTFRGTIEFRSACCQPVKDAMAIAAFHIGLIEKIDNVEKILSEDTVLYNNGFTSSQLREMMNKSELPDFIDVDKLYGLATKIVNLAYETLKNRGYGEEKYLLMLYKRIENRTNPAKYMLDSLYNGKTIEDIIKLYGEI